MIPVPPLATHGPGPWPQRFAAALRHPVHWLTDLTGNGPVYALLVLFGFNMVDEFDRTGFGLLLPNIRDHFELTNTGILSLVAAASLLGLALQVPIAWLADRQSRVRLMLVGASVFALFTVGTGLSVAVWMLVLMRAGSGVGLATVWPTHNSLLADWFPIAARPRVFSFHRAANAIGAFIGPLLAGVLAAWGGWRVPFLVFAVPTVILVLAGLRLREPIRGQQERAAMGASAEAVVTEEVPPSFAEGWRTVWKIESLRRIFWALPFLAASLIGYASLAAILYETRFGLDEVQRSWIAAAAEPVQLVGLVVGARVGTRLIQRDPGLVIRFVAYVAFFTAGLAALFALAPYLSVAVVVNMGLSAALAIIGPGVFAALSLAIPPRARSLGYSMGALFVIPGLVVLPIIGWFTDTFSIEVGMMVMAPVFLAGGLILSTAGRVIDRDIKQVWTTAAARSEVLYERRQGRVKLLLVRQLQVAYGDVQVLFDVDFEIDEGEVVALLGTNGAGKSTLLKAICGVTEADKGAVIFDGRDITHVPPDEIAALGVTMVPGGQGVFPSLTVAENLRVASWIDRHHPAAVAERTAEVLGRFPVLRERLGEPAANLSGGQQQQLALAMAFLSRPRLLMIDELSLGLAPAVVEQLLEVVRAIQAQGTTIILVEQSVNVALAVAERAYFMEKGEIRFSGETAELLDRPDVLRSVFLEGAAAGMAAVSAAPPAATAPAGPAIPTVPTIPGDAATTLAAISGDGDQQAVSLPALETRGLCVHFGGIRAVDEVSVEVRPGEILGIIGPNGAGKTTLFDLVSGYLRPSSGLVLLAGRDVTRMGPDARARRGIGRSFQDARLFPSMTVEETIAVALDRWVDVRDPLNAALRMPAFQDSEHAVGLRVDELVELLGLGAFRSKFVRELSTGSRRVVDLACLVAHGPSVILLDEPSSGIAQKEAEALAPLLVRIRDTLGASLMVIEHDMPLVTTVADRLIALDQGRVIAEGLSPEVLAHPDVVASYLGDSNDVIARSGARSR
ncbi:MFS transporter [Rhabdothermincola sediminis]|uniref:MFS transporter n=1 Tax=Rhabdothermincola sediminis TaxID=2751370 RepID=UPI001AA03ECC|nr:MFS transporter [Rhabdothermincola sediminis]